MMSKRIACGYAVLCLSLHAQAQNMLSPQEIQATWVGKSITAVIASGSLSGKEFLFRLRSDGTSSIQGPLQDTGKWRLSDNGYCNRWEKIRSGEERCFTVVRRDKEFLIMDSSGALNSTVLRVE